MKKVFKKMDIDLFYACAIAEKIARDTKAPISAVAKQMGVEGLAHVIEYADVFHCLPVEQARDEIMELYDIKYDGSFDNISVCEYRVPTYWEIGKVYARLTQDVQDERSFAEMAYEVLTSWMSERISDFNSAMYFSSRDYLEWAYKLGEEAYDAPGSHDFPSLF